MTRRIASAVTVALAVLTFTACTPMPPPDRSTTTCRPNDGSVECTSSCEWPDRPGNGVPACPDETTTTTGDINCQALGCPGSPEDDE